MVKHGFDTDPLRMINRSDTFGITARATRTTKDEPDADDARWKMQLSVLTRVLGHLELAYCTDGTNWKSLHHEKVG